MVQEYVYSPHYDFFIDWAHRDAGYEMRTFHIHEKYELYYEIDGTRRYYIDDAAYLINAGNLVLIGPYSVHKTGNVDNCPHTRFVLNFNGDYLAELSGIFPEVNLFACFEAGISVLNVPMKRQGALEHQLQRLWEAREDKTPAGNALRKVQVSELLLDVARMTAEEKLREAAPQRICNRTIDLIQSYISTHYKEELPLSLIASQFYISPCYLSHLFKKITNLSVTEYVNSVRLMAAKKLLETTGLKVSEVAFETGFSTAAHFSRIFKEGTGLSPQQYRGILRKHRS